MLRPLAFSAAIIAESVPTLPTEDPIEHSDTDDDTEGKTQRGIGASVSKFTSRHHGGRSKIRLRPSEINHNQPLAQIKKGSCRKLAEDAFRIANAHPNARTRKASTCLCVVLQDEEWGVRKLVAHNSINELQPSTRAKADELMYGIRNAYLTHAETWLIDFLLYRARQREDKIKNNGEASHPRYTHILGMGCSRKHCRECDTLCKLFLGEDYTAHTPAVSQLGNSEQIPLIDTVAQEAGVDLTVTIHRCKSIKWCSQGSCCSVRAKAAQYQRSLADKATSIDSCSVCLGSRLLSTTLS